MAPRKEKVEKTSDEDGTQMVLGYLKRQNRPYSAIDISANLHNRVTKTQAVKILKHLHEKNCIKGKAAGKQFVYHSLHDSSVDTSPERLAAIDAEIEKQNSSILALQAEEKALRAKLAALSIGMNLCDLEAALDATKAQRCALQERLGPLREGKIKPVSEKERKEVEELSKICEKRMKARRKICEDLWAIVAEQRAEGQGKADFWEELGLEGEVL